MSDFDNSRVRIERIEVSNVKGVHKGVIEFNCAKNTTEKDTCSNILGLYGQNGSGKTTLLEILQLIRTLMLGNKISASRYENLISKDTEESHISVSFLVNENNGDEYHLGYAFSLKMIGDKDSFSNDSKLSKVALATMMVDTLLATVIGAGGAVYDHVKKKRLVVYDEVLSMSGRYNGTEFRQGPIMDTSARDAVFVPKSRYKSFFSDKIATVMNKLQIYKELSYKNSTSFIFSEEMADLLRSQSKPSELGPLILRLEYFAGKQFRVLDNKFSSPLGDDKITLFTPHMAFEIDKRSSITKFSRESLPVFINAVKALNAILNSLIPGLSIEVKEQIDVDLIDGSKIESLGCKVKVNSVRNGVRIPISEESSGIIRLISSLGLFVYAFANDGVTVAIDEIDAGIYEYLLGKLLLAFEKEGCGQLIFTCHNLRPLEVLNKKDICLTTTNPDKRYLRLKGIRNEQNLRDVYLSEIIAGGQEELYDAADDIADALRTAGDIFREAEFKMF